MTRERRLETEALAWKMLRDAAEPMHSKDVSDAACRYLISEWVRRGYWGRPRTVTRAEAAQACKALAAAGRARHIDGPAGGKWEATT